MARASGARHTRRHCVMPPATIVGGINMLVDITEQKHADQKLRDSEQRFTQFMQHLPGLAWIKDADGRYVYANDAAERAFQARRADLRGKSDQDLFPPETALQFREHDREVLNDGSSIQTVETLRHPDGVVHHSIVNKFAIPSPKGTARWLAVSPSTSRSSKMPKKPCVKARRRSVHSRKPTPGWPRWSSPPMTRS